MRTFLLHFFYLSSQLDNLLVSCSKCWMWRTIIHWPRMIARGGWTKAYPSNTAISLCTEDLCKCIVGLPKYAYVNVISLQLWPLYHKLFHLCLVITNKQNNRAIIHMPTWVICFYIYKTWVGVIIKEKKGWVRVIPCVLRTQTINIVSLWVSIKYLSILEIKNQHVKNYNVLNLEVS